MKVTKNITIDLNNPRRHVVHLMESGNQREIVLTLLKDGMPFDVSEDIGTATLVKGVGYIKANGVPGYYDWTSTDEAAVAAVSGTTNKWTVRLDEHATDVPGFAQIFVKFSLASGETLYSFPIVLDVIRTSGGTTDPDKPYYHSTSFLLAGAQAAKTPAMSFPVGVDGDGKLWAEGGWSADAKEALLACFEQVAWKTPYGQTYLSALETALYPEVHLASITADYEQDRPILDTDSLDIVRLDLIVTANYSDGTSERLADDAYELSGTLVAGQTCEITVEYGGKTATINVVVTYRMSFALQDGTLVMNSGGTSYNTTDGPIFCISPHTTANTRRAFAASVGAIPLKLSTNGTSVSGVSDTAFMIPIPPTATKVTASITPSSQYLAISRMKYSNGVWGEFTDTGWKQGSFAQTMTAGEYQYLFCNSKKNSSGSAYSGDQPTNFTIEFE